MPRPTALLCLALLLATAPFPASAKTKGADPAKPNKPAKPAPTERVGLVLKVEPTQLTVQTYGKVPSELLVPVNAKTQVQVEGEPATLADIKPGMNVLISPVAGTAQKILAHKEGKKKNKDKKKDKASPAPAPEK
jgi:hypothetical protein